MILLIDNYDSFTYNIVQYLLELGADLKVIRNDELSVEEIKALNPQKLIISPGPATPNEAGVCLDVIKEFSSKIPILGVCLGHQAIGQAFGADIIKAPNMMHGKTSKIEVSKSSCLFDGLPREFTQTRYHSLIVDKTNLPNTIEPLAYSKDDGELMALKIKGLDVYGVQFHPESVMSEYGKEILQNFLDL
ncbi:MAG: aminodeoxychorismate/anthranilate synthase component II [Arcobacter butzleri]|nr:aminodeoxychorismate/anthranilate synthase component II [Aliarcobacter butzleri]